MPIARLSAVPRETRDTWLVLAVVALVLLPHAPHLPWWASAAAAAALLWRAQQVKRGLPLPRTWAMATLLCLVLGATWWQFRSLIGPEAGVVLVALLLVLKTLEMRARRDAMVIFFLGFFTLLTLFLQSQSLTTAAAMLLAVWGLLAALTNAHLPAGYPPLRQLLRTSATLMALGAPLMLVLFVTFPRFAPLWGLPALTAQGRTGLSNDMTVGQVASLAQDPSVALRVRFDLPAGQTPSPDLLYFRGPVLVDFDGRSWNADTNEWGTILPPGSALQATAIGDPVNYEVTLEAHQQRWLLTLDATLTPPRSALRRVVPTRDLQWLSARPLNEVLRYKGQAHLHYQYGHALPAAQRPAFTRLPAHSNPRTTAWAHTLRRVHGSNDAAVVAAALQHLRTGGFTYTLEPGAVLSPHTADDFWFDSQQGFCEHIASAFAVLMRAADIPTRIVTGYQGGERNPIDQLWTVRQSDAHAWTEVWLPEQGWVRIDPTSAVSPSRTAQLQRLLPAPTLFSHTVGRVLGTHALARMRAQWEAINHRWNDWVLNYSSTAQTQLLQAWGLSAWSWRKIAFLFGALVVGASAAWGLHRWYKQRAQDPWLRLMHQARQQLTRAGLSGAGQSTPQQLVQAAQALWGDESAPLQHWLRQMEQWRYAPHLTDTPTLPDLRRRYRALPWPRHRTP